MTTTANSDILTPEPRKLLIAMPGIAEWQETFWKEVIIPLGLEPHSSRIFQANAFVNNLFPKHALKKWSRGEIRDLQADHTTRLLNAEWDGPEFVMTYGDYEPKMRINNVDHHWQWQKIQFGYDELDREFLWLIRDGILRGVSPPYMLYNSAIHPSAQGWNDQFAVRATLTYDEIANDEVGDDAIWQGLYPSRNPAHNNLDIEHIADGLAAKVITGNRLKRTLGKPVIPAMFFRHFQDNVDFQRRTLHLLNATGSDRLIVWVQCGERDRFGNVDPRASRFMLDEYKRQWTASAADLHRWLERQPVEVDAPQQQEVA